MRLGIIVGLTERPEEALGKARDLDLPTCQLSCWRSDILTAEMAERVRQPQRKPGEITCMGGVVWPCSMGFYDGPLTWPSAGNLSGAAYGISTKRRILPDAWGG